MAFIKAPVMEVQSNPFRDDTIYVWDENVIEKLIDSMHQTSFWENVLARKLADGTIQLAYGHKRLEAFRRLCERDEEFKKKYTDDAGVVKITLNVRPEKELPDSTMMEIFARENAEDWGDTPHNACMTIYQGIQYLNNIAETCETVEEFQEKTGGKLKTDAAAFTKMKKNGASPSQVNVLFGGAWGRTTIGEAAKLLKDPEILEKAKQLPSVTMADRYRKLVETEDGGKVDAKVQDELLDLINTSGIARKGVEEALKLTKNDPDFKDDPVKALSTVVKEEAKKMKASAPTPTRKSPLEKTQEVIGGLITRMRANKNWTVEELETLALDLEAVGDVIVELSELAKNPPKKDEKGK